MILIIILYVQVNVVDMLNLFAIINQKKLTSSGNWWVD